MNALTFAQSPVSVSKAPVRKKYSKIDYKDASGSEVSLAYLAGLYGVSEKTITRKFSDFNGDHKEANYDLIDRNLVADCYREPGVYMRKVYRAQEG